VANKYNVSRGMSAAIEKGFRQAGINEKDKSLDKISSLELLPTSNVKDISIMSKMTNLHYAYLDKNRIVDITPLKNLTNLIQLNLDYNFEITDLTPISSIKSLQYLSITGLNKVKVFDPLLKLKKLISLSCRTTQITSETLSKIPNLKTVNFSTIVEENRYWYYSSCAARNKPCEFRYGVENKTNPFNGVTIHCYSNGWLLNIDDFILLINAKIKDKKYIMDFLDIIFKKYSPKQVKKLILDNSYMILSEDIQKHLIMNDGIKL